MDLEKEILEVEEQEESKEEESSPQNIFQDKPDTINPDFSTFKPTYDVVCRERYIREYRKYNQFFKNEIKELELMQPNAYEQMRFYRIFALTSLWPPLHNRKEIETTTRELFKLPNQKSSARVNYILSNKIG